MPRIRTVKPEISFHEGLYDLEVELELPVRFFWAALPCHCCREGRFEWLPRRLKAQILPYDNFDISRVLDALQRVGMLEKYEFNGKVYGRIPTFLKHQVINGKEKASDMPPPPEKEIDHLYLGVNIPKPVFERISNRDGGKCLSCGSHEDLTLDHVIPQFMQFNNSEENLRTLCRPCNSSRVVNGEELQCEIDAWYQKTNPQNHAYLQVSNAWPRVPQGKEGKGKEQDIGQKRSTRFKPPKMDDLKAYQQERGTLIDLERFRDFYESKNWMVGKNKMKDWKAAFRNWAKNEKNQNSEPEQSEFQKAVKRGKELGVEWQGHNVHTPEEFIKEVNHAAQ